MPRITHVLLADGLPLASWVERGLPRDWGLAGRTWTSLELEVDGQPMTAAAALRRDELDCYDTDYLEDERWRALPAHERYDGPYDEPLGSAQPVVPAQRAEELGWEALQVEVGGEEALRALSAEPLPVEDVDWQLVPAQAVEAVGSVLARIDQALQRWPDAEVRTACQRLLVSAAVRQPLLVGATESDRTAAAVYWAVGRASHLIGPEARALNQDVWGHFGVGSSVVSSLARRLVGPVWFLGGVDRYVPGAGHGTGFLLGRADLLVSSRRARLVRERDRLLPLLEALGGPGVVQGPEGAEGLEVVRSGEADWEGSLRLLLGGVDE